MLRLLTIFLFIGFSSTLTAQNAELLQGKWVFKQALNKGIDKAGRETLKKDVINKMTLEFKNNGDFIGSLFGAPAVGKWSISKNSKSLILSTQGQKLEFLILELSQTRLILKMGLGEFLMKKL